MENNTLSHLEPVDTIIVGGGQAGLAMSEHLSEQGVSHRIFEQSRIAERWRTARWDSLVANGPAWHDRFPSREFDMHPDAFAHKDEVVDYFVAFAEQIKAPVHCGVTVTRVSRRADGTELRVETSAGVVSANNVVVATGPFQTPVIPPVVPAEADVHQLHSHDYYNPDQLPDGAVLVVGAGSSGSQIADELLRAGRTVYLSVGPHDRPPRRYRDRDFVWWLGVLGKWEMKTPEAGREHVTIAVSGAEGGRTVDFRRFAERGMQLVGMTRHFSDGVMHFAPDLAENVAAGDANYLSVLDEADAYVAREGIDLPVEPGAREIGPDPRCLTHPTLSLDLAQAGVGSIIWATGYAQDFSWIDLDTFEAGKPVHERGVSKSPGLYFLGLPWLSMRGSSFIWGVWQDAKYLASRIAGRSDADN